MYFCAMKRKKEPFNKESGKKVSFEDVVNLIGAPSEYHFAIIENGVDEELIDIARKAGIDLTGYKHVIETSGTSHSQNSLFFNRLESEKPPKNRGLFFSCYRRGCHALPVPYVLIIRCFSIRFCDQPIANIQSF